MMYLTVPDRPLSGPSTTSTASFTLTSLPAERGEVGEVGQGGEGGVGKQQYGKRRCGVQHHVRYAPLVAGSSAPHCHPWHA